MRKSASTVVFAVVMVMTAPAALRTVMRLASTGRCRSDVALGGFEKRTLVEGLSRCLNLTAHPDNVKEALRKPMFD